MTCTREMRLFAFTGLVALALIGLLLFLLNSRQPVSAYPPPGPDASVTRAELMPPGTRFRGPANAPFTLVEFVDLQCPRCKGAAITVDRIMKAHPNDLRITAHYFQTNIIHRHAGLLARGVTAAAAQGKSWQMHDRLLDTQTRFDGEDVEKARQSLRDAARALRLNMARFDRDLDSAAARTAWNGDLALARHLKVSGTPAFFFVGPSGAPIRLWHAGQMVDWLDDPRHWR